MKTEDILSKIKAQHHKTGGHNGLKLVDFDMDLTLLKNELNELSKKGKIKVREGKSGKLIFYKEDHV